MLHSRLSSPKQGTINNKQGNQKVQPIVRSKSSISFVQIMSAKLQSYQNIKKNTSIKQVKIGARASSAVKKVYEDSGLVSLPKVSVAKGKLHLGKVFKPELILSSQVRCNPWTQPAPLNQNLIYKKGLMNMINMGALPKNTDFTQLLNHRYQQKKQPTVIPKQTEKQDFFQTNPILAQTDRSNPLQIVQKQQKQQELSKVLVNQQSQILSPDKKNRKRIKKGHSNKKSKKQLNILFPQEPIILQISNKVIVKDQKYEQALKNMRKEGQQVIFKYFINQVQKFAAKYQLKKFQFRVAINETCKISDTVIKDQIINAKALGVHLAMKGNIRKRVNEILSVLALRFRFKQSLQDILKIQKIKRYFKIKKYYQQMTKKRCDFIRFKLGSFAQRQRRFIQQSLQKNSANERFRIQIHLLSTSGKTCEQQLSYYKSQARNNIQLTRIFNNQPEYIILLFNQQQLNLQSWLKILKKLKGFHPLIQPIFSRLKINSNVKAYDSIYYGLNPSIIRKIRAVCGKKQDLCIYPSSFNNTLVKICQAFNAKLFSSSFIKSHLQKLLLDESQQQINDNQSFLKIKNMVVQSLETKVQQMNKKQSKFNQSISESEMNLPNSLPDHFANGPQRILTEGQIKHLVQKIKIKQLSCYELVGEYFSNKLRVKKDILIQFNCETPFAIIFEPKTDEQILYRKLAQAIISYKNVNKWVFKIGSQARFSRGLAYLQTDSLKILKEKKKKIDLSETDIVQVASIMKLILIDKIEIPQSSLHDSTQFLNKFISEGGFVETVLSEVESVGVFGKISATGNLELLGTYQKIYTDEGVNCSATYPSALVSEHHLQDIKVLSKKMYENYQIFGNVTFQLLINKKTRKHYFIDVLLCLEQYSSFYFMYNAIFNHYRQQSQSLTIIKKVKQGRSKILLKNQKNKQKNDNEKGLKKITSQANENSVQSSNQVEDLHNDEKEVSCLRLPRKIIYIPFIDNNGVEYETIQQFEDAYTSRALKILDFDQIQGIQFLYLNLKQLRPDVLSMVIFSKSEKKCLKYALEGLNFLVDLGQKTNKFDKKVQRRKYDCLYIHDIVWKFRQMKKTKDSIKL